MFSLLDSVKVTIMGSFSRPRSVLSVIGYFFYYIHHHVHRAFVLGFFIVDFVLLSGEEFPSRAEYYFITAT